MWLIEFAYANHDSPHSLWLPASQIVGGPPWISKPGYNIEGKPESATDNRHAWLMVADPPRLADRFKLAM